MKDNIRNNMIKKIEEFRLPRYREIPDVGLYLDQVTKYIEDYLMQIDDSTLSLTPSMISNYVKKKIIDNPIKKQYYREQIAYLIFVALAKSVMSLEDISLMIHLQKMSYTGERAYNYFVEELENVLKAVFREETELKEIGVDKTLEKNMLRNAVIAISHKVYLDALFAQVREAEQV